MSSVVEPLLAAFKFVIGIPAHLLIFATKVYQNTFGQMYRGVCRFEPSCSRYFILAVQKHGAIIGTLKGIWRICRCNPFNEGGEDLP